MATDLDGPCFVADAVSDPLSGVVGAASIISALTSGERWLLDIAMAPMAASVLGESVDLSGLDVAPPQARRATSTAPCLGANNAAVLGDLVS